jgi:hypothetical protein
MLLPVSKITGNSDTLLASHGEDCASVVFQCLNCWILGKGDEEKGEKKETKERTCE